MLKTIATIAAFATLAATIVAPAHAVMNPNGIGLNGITQNGLSTNGLSTNGLTTNGLTTNGLSSNGGENGGGINGHEDGDSTLSIQAFELPPETR